MQTIHQNVTSIMRVAPLIFLGAGFFASCQNPNAADGEGTGTLQVRANGEDFIRQGFTSKDGWQIQFDRAEVVLSDVIAYQTDPPFDAQGNDPLEALEEVVVVERVTVDLAEGDETAEPIAIGEANVPAGRYNALAWTLGSGGQKPEESAAQETIVLEGTAQKDDRTVPFELRLGKTLPVVCGDYVGDERKGIVKPGETAELEATFHFDHLFGDQGLPVDDDLNQGALGFEPLAALAQDNGLNVGMTDLETALPPEAFQRLLAILPDLPHVGEGHCRTVSHQEAES